MKEYTVGFLFDKPGLAVLLLRKTRPEWQAGKLNGVGGKLEPGESPLDCMVREGAEEAGLDGVEWTEFCTISSARVYDPEYQDGWRVHFFYCFDTVAFRLAGPLTDEPIERWPTDTIYNAPVIPNLRWLIPMALSFRRGERAKLFEVIEQ